MYTSIPVETLKKLIKLGQETSEILHQLHPIFQGTIHDIKDPSPLYT